jgi:4-hydroxybenzoate polyprenyltransferase
MNRRFKAIIAWVSSSLAIIVLMTVTGTLHLLAWATVAYLALILVLWYYNIHQLPSQRGRVISVVVLIGVLIFIALIYELLGQSGII